MKGKSKAFLRALRKKYKLGEFAKNRKRRRAKARRTVSRRLSRRPARAAPPAPRVFGF